YSENVTLLQSGAYSQHMLFRVWSGGPVHIFTEAVSMRCFGSRGGDMSNWVRVLRRIGGLATISWVVCVMFSVAAHAQSFNITNLTAGAATTASFPNMVVDGKGNTYLAWIDTSNGGIVVASHFDGNKFNAQFVIKTAVLPAFQ